MKFTWWDVMAIIGIITFIVVIISIGILCLYKNGAGASEYTFHSRDFEKARRKKEREAKKWKN